MVLTEVIFPEQLVIPQCPGAVVGIPVAFHKLFGTEDIRFPGYTIVLQVAFVGDGDFPRLACFGLYDDHAVGCPGAIYGCGRAVFQYRDGFDILVGKVSQVAAGHAIDDDQRAVSRFQGGGATYLEVVHGIPVGIGSRIIGYGEAGHLPVDHLHGVVDRSLEKVLAADLGYGRGEVSSFHTAIAHDHNLFEQAGIFHHDHFDAVPPGQRHILLLHAHIRDGEGAIGRYIVEEEVPIDIGHGTAGGALHLHRRPD